MNGFVATRGDVYLVSIGYLGSKPSASQLLCLHTVPIPVTFPAELKGSNGRCKTTATAQADFDVKKNGVSIGTIRFAIGAATPTFIMTPAARFLPGDYLEVFGPASQDSTLQDVTLTLSGVR